MHTIIVNVSQNSTENHILNFMNLKNPIKKYNCG